MGMAASQARLLCITARIHDVEHQAQAIQHAKLQLGIQSDRVYNEYVAALDATTMTVKTFDPKSAQSATVAATFNNLCSRNRAFIAGGLNYAIHVNGWLLVEDEIEEGYQEFKNLGYGDDATDFAMFMLYGNSPAQNAHNQNNNNNNNNNGNGNNGGGGFTPIPAISPEEFTPSSPAGGGPARGAQQKPDAGFDQNEDLQTKPEADDTVKAVAPPPLTPEINDTPAQVAHPSVYYPEDEAMFNYYRNIFLQIQASGGCVSIADYGDQAANDSEWLKKMIESGVFTISTVEEIDEDDDGEKDYAKFSATSPSSDTNLAYTTTSEIDSTALKKAEAKYENDMRKINQKDKQFDLDLSKLETERSALTTQYDSIKKVIEDNIERTFGIFS